MAQTRCNIGLASLLSTACAAAMLSWTQPAQASTPTETTTTLSFNSSAAFSNSAGTTLPSAAVKLDFAQEAAESYEAAEWTLNGPYFLRSADPLEPGELQFKFVYGFERANREGEEHEFEFVLDWGLMEDNEFILKIPVTLGEGKVEGNGDISEFGLHTKFWDETETMPAFAMRNLIRIPTGYKSDGVDYLARGLFTKTLIPDTMRLHFNPFGKSVNGNLQRDTRRFQWGAAIGFDYWLTDNLLVIVDYQNFSSTTEGNRNQQVIELGADWEFADNEILGLQAEFEVDGDGQGADFGFRISYILELAAPEIGGYVTAASPRNAGLDPRTEITR